MRGTVLVVDDHAMPRRALAAELEDAGFTVLEAADGAEAWDSFCRFAPDVVITDMVMPRSDGLDLLGRIRTRSEVPVILFTAQGSVATAASAFKLGADDFVASADVEVEDLVNLVTTAMLGGERPGELPGLETRLVGQSQVMRRIRSRISGLATLRTPVLVSGEPGTGRDTVAVALHELGHSMGGRLMRVEGASFTPPAPLLPDGAIYVDGIETLSAEGQSYWAGRLAKEQMSEFRGSARFLASTSAVLASRIEQGSFDRKLGAILLRFQLELPALRSRLDDIPDLAKALVERLSRSVGRGRVRLSAAAIELLQKQRFIGNVSQLELILERSVAYSLGRVIKREVVQEVIDELEDSIAVIRERRSLHERDALIRALRDTGGNVSQAAEQLGRSRSAIYRLIEKHGIPLNRGG